MHLIVVTGLPVPKEEADEKRGGILMAVKLA
jgi:hypothetical protein